MSFRGWGLDFACIISRTNTACSFPGPGAGSTSGPEGMGVGLAQGETLIFRPPLGGQGRVEMSGLVGSWVLWG